MVRKGPLLIKARKQEPTLSLSGGGKAGVVSSSPPSLPPSQSPEGFNGNSAAEQQPATSSIHGLPIQQHAPYSGLPLQEAASGSNRGSKREEQVGPFPRQGSVGPAILSLPRSPSPTPLLSSKSASPTSRPGVKEGDNLLLPEQPLSPGDAEPSSASLPSNPSPREGEREVPSALLVSFPPAMPVLSREASAVDGSESSKGLASAAGSSSDKHERAEKEKILQAMKGFLTKCNEMCTSVEKEHRMVVVPLLREHRNHQDEGMSYAGYSEMYAGLNAARSKFVALHERHQEVYEKMKTEIAVYNQRVKEIFPGEWREFSDLRDRIMKEIAENLAVVEMFLKRIREASLTS